MDIDQQSVAMGVVVQLMLEPDVSGILFTANPSSGERSELVINASFGLGESVVGGRVTPDTYVVDRTSFEPKDTRINAKLEMIVPATEQGTKTQTVAEARQCESSLSNALLRDLSSLSVKVEQLFDGLPQDIEWAIADGRCWLLQSRPITNLPPSPLRDVSWGPPSKGAKLIRRQVVENMPEPLSPLFDELYLRIGLEQAIDQFMIDFGMSVNFEEFMERPMFLTVNGFAYCRASYRASWRLVWIFPKMLFAYFRLLPRLLRNLIPDWRDKGLPVYLETIERWKLADIGDVSDDRLLKGVRELAVADANYWFKVSIILAAAKVTDGLLNRFLTSRLRAG